MQQLAALWSLLSGKKTYILTALAALWPVLAPLLGQTGTDFNLQNVLIALAIAALRAGVASSNPLAGFAITLLPQLQVFLQELQKRGPAAEKFLAELLAEIKTLPPAPAPDPVVPFDPNALRPGGTSLNSWLLLGLICLPASAWAASPEAIIKGPRTAIPGEFLRYDFSTSKEMKGFRLKIDDDRTLPDGIEVIRVNKAEKYADVASFEGKFRLTLTVWDESDDSDEAELAVVVASPQPRPPAPTPPEPPAPTPTPNPQPTPPAPQPTPTPVPPAPEPVLPEGKFGVIHKARDLATAVVSPTKAAEVKCLVDGCVTIKARIAAGTLKGPQAIANAVGDVLKSCVSTAWDDARNRLADAVADLFAKGLLRTDDDWRTLVDELQQGLQAAK